MNPSPPEEIERIALESITATDPRPVDQTDQPESTDGRDGPDGRDVDGRPIDDECDHQRLGVVARIKLFVSVCEAVHGAHQHGAIHGDLKPQNILVTSSGVPRLTDFGVGRVAQARLSEYINICNYELEAERSHAFDCLSPEQFEGEPAATTSDVYALGVVLYRLLSGRWPYRVKEHTISQVRKAVSEQAPQRPSEAVFRRDRETMGQIDSRAEDSSTDVPAPESPPEQIARARSSTPGRLRRTLAGDLDAIVARALSKSPESRYQSVEQLAEDLRCWIAGAPVRARGEFRFHAPTRLARRRKALITSFAIVVVGLAALAAGILAGRHRPLLERDQALARLGAARFAFSAMFSRASEERLLRQPAFKPLREALLEQARSYDQSLVDQAGKNPALDPDFALAHARLGKIASLTGRPEQALAHYQQAARLWDELVLTAPDDVGYQFNRIEALEGLAEALSSKADQIDQALGALERARSLSEILLAENPRSIPIQRELGRILLAIAELENQKGQTREALQTLENVLSIEANLEQDDSTDLDFPITSAHAHAAQGRIHAKQTADEPQKALEAYQAAIDRLIPITRQHPELAEESQLLAACFRALSRLEQRTRRDDDALHSLEQSKNLLERLVESNPSAADFQADLAAVYDALGDMIRRRGEIAEALVFARKAAPLLEKLATLQPENVVVHASLAKAQVNLGRLLERTGDPASALRSFQRAIDLYESISHPTPDDHYNLAAAIGRSIPLIGKAAATPSAIDRTRVRIYGDRAMTALKKARHAGFLTTEMIQNDPDLDALRDRDDFRALVKEIEDAPSKSP